MKKKQIVPRPLPHQKPCLKIIRRNLLAGVTPMLFVMASGLGKTFMSAFAFQMFRRMAKRARVLFLAHQVDLLDQAKVTFEKIFRDQISYGHFNGVVKKADADAVFATLQSMNVALFKGKQKRKRRPFGQRGFDCVIVDESHHGQAFTYKEVIDYFQPRCLIGMTATPDRTDLKDIREIFGKEIFSLDLVDALAQGLLTPVDYRILADEIVDKGKLKVPPHLVGITQLNRIFFNRKRDREVVRIILDRVAKVEEPKIIVFTGSIKHAEKFSKLIPGAAAIHSSVPPAVREQRLALFRQGLLRVAVTVDQFNEGMDIPEANVLVFLRSTQSKTVFFQQIGRGLRRVQGKDKVLVLDFVANIERLALLDELHREVKARRHKRGGTHQEVRVDWGQVVFEERARDAVELLKKVRVGLTPEVLLDYMRDFYRRTGLAPTSRDLLSSKGMPSYKTFTKYFGSLQKACKLAGIPEEALPKGVKLLSLPIEARKRYLRDQLIQFYRRTGRAPTSKDLLPSKGMPSYKTFTKYFGSPQKACKLAGIPVEVIRPKRVSTKSPVEVKAKKRFLLNQVVQFYRRTGRAPTFRDLQRSKGMPSRRTYNNYFGTLAEIYRLAGIPEKAMTREQRKYVKRIAQR